MKVQLTPQQASVLRYDEHPDFVRAAFFTGHAYEHIIELANAAAYASERATIVSLAFALGMNELDKVEVLNSGS